MAINHRSAANENVHVSSKIAPGDLDSFRDILLHETTEAAEEFFDRLLKRGVTVDTLFTDLLSPAAVQLGAMWVDDTASFGDVTLGVATLHQLLRTNSKLLHREITVMDHDLSILTTPMPEANHIFGTAMIEEYFRAWRWRTLSGFDLRERELLDMVQKDEFSAVGISVSTTDALPACGKLVTRFRQFSNNKDLKIIVGGAAFGRDDKDWKMTGADGFAYDAHGAVQRAFDLCGT